MLQQQIPISWAKRQATRAVANGLSLDKAFASALITEQYGDERDKISPLQLTLFQSVLVQQTDDGTHAMLSQRMAPETGPLGFRVLLGSANLGDGLEALAQFHRLVSHGIRLDLTTSGAFAFVAIHADGEDDFGMVEEDIQLVYLYFGLTAFLGQPFPASWITTRDQRHINLDGPHYVMRGVVKLGSRAGIAFPKALLARSSAGRFDEFRWRLVRNALHMLERPAGGAGAQVTNANFHVKQLADERMVAPSTLRRRMAQEGLTFRQQREAALLDATLDLLRTRSCCVDAIAAELGYADARSLRRFVKRATGQTPNELRTASRWAPPPAQLYARMEDVFSQFRH